VNKKTDKNIIFHDLYIYGYVECFSHRYLSSL